MGPLGAGAEVGGGIGRRGGSWGWRMWGGSICGRLASTKAGIWIVDEVAVDVDVDRTVLFCPLWLMPSLSSPRPEPAPSPSDCCGRADGSGALAGGGSGLSKEATFIISI